MRNRTAAAGIGVVALALAILLPAAAQAHDPLRGGKTTLKLDAGTAKALAANGVKVKVLKPARAKGSKIRFPITGGGIDSGQAKGSIRHSGGLKFKAGGKSLAAKSFKIELGKKAKLTARVGKARVPLLKLNTRKAKVSRVGLATKISRVKTSLTGAAARALNDTFSVKLFRAGIDIGKTKTVAKPESVKTRGGNTSLTLDPDTAAALTSLGISAAPVDPASAKPNGSLAFPVKGGRVDAKSFAGTIRHSGGIELTDGVTTVALTRFDIQIDEDPDLTALLGPDRVSILDLDLSGLKASVNRRGTIKLAGVSAALTQGAADALDGAFGTTAFEPGLVLGTTVTKARTG